MATIDQQFVEYIVKSLAEYPDDVKVERAVDDKGVLLILTVNPEDLGRIIGKRGMTAQSLRTLLRSLGSKNEERYNLKIINSDEPNELAQTPKTEPVNNPTDEPVENASDYSEKTRKELAELDDLDI